MGFNNSESEKRILQIMIKFNLQETSFFIPKILKAYTKRPKPFDSCQFRGATYLLLNVNDRLFQPGIFR